LTRLAVLADLHGNLPALEAVAAEVDRASPDAVVVAGDLLTWGPFARETLDLVSARGWAVIRGNSELYLVDWGTPRADPAWLDPDWFATLHRLIEELGDWRPRVAVWPDQLSLRLPDGPPIRVVHGSPRSHWEGMTPLTPEEGMLERLAGVEEALVVCGHTHLATDRRVGRWRVVNPGSLGVPLDGDRRAGYMLLDAVDGDWRPSWHRVEYDQSPLLERMRREERDVVGALVRREFETARTQLVPFRRWLTERGPGVPGPGRPTFDLLPEFERASLWDYTSGHFRVNPGPGFSP
jgi:predicted phosphodiesterase